MNLRILLFTVALAFLTSVTSFAAAAPVRIEQGWVRAVPSSSTDTAAYMILTNNSDKPLHLTGGRTAIAEMVMPMTSTKKIVNGQEVMGMSNVDSLVIPAHGRLILSPDGDHLMLMTLKEHPAAGAKIKITLTFGPGNLELVAELPVALSHP